VSAETSIRCTRCESVAPWGPFCPRCGAYLEFAGDPPWHPDIVDVIPGAEPPAGPEQVTEEILVTAVTTAESSAGTPPGESDFSHLYSREGTPQASVETPRSSGMGIAAVVGVLVIGVIGGLGLTLLTNGWIGGVFALMCLAWALVLVPRRGGRAASTSGVETGPTSRAGLVAVALILVVGLVRGIGLGFLTNVWIGATFGLVCLAWALVLWPRPRIVPEAPPVVQPAVDRHTAESEVLLVEAVDVVVAEREAPPAVEARAPQDVPTRVIEVPVTAKVSTAIGDVPCPECGGLNFESRHYCQWCGAVMPGVLVAPTTVPHVDQDVDPERGADSRGRAPRLSRSWRGPIVAGTLAFVFLSAVLLTVFGPFAFQFRLGTTQIFQAINQFIDPYAGESPEMQGATATSTLTGTDPDQLLGDDASTFWASEPSFIFGAGNSITITFNDSYTINRAVILPGIQNNLLDVRALATPASVTLTFDDGSSVSQELDTVASQRDYRQLIRFPETTTTKVTLTIDSVYPPRKGSANLVGEVAISGIYFLTPPEPPSIISVPTEIRDNPALPGTTN